MDKKKGHFIVFCILTIILIFFFLTILYPFLLYRFGLENIVYITFNYLVIFSLFSFLPVLIAGSILSMFNKTGTISIYFLFVGFFLLMVLLISIFISSLTNATFYQNFLERFF